MKVVNIKNEGCTVYIGRPSRLGNPFHIDEHRTRAKAIEMYESYARRVRMHDIRELPSDAILGCYCSPKPCHGDVIIKIWKELHE